jgi:CBS domain-containing protein
MQVQVQDIMTRDVITVRPDMNVHDLAQLFIERDISGAPVVGDDGTLRGVVMEEDLILQDKKIHLPTLISILSGVISLGEKRFEQEMQKMSAITVAGIMQMNPPVLAPGTLVEDVATRVIEQGVHYFPVLDQGKLVGVVTKKDIVRAIAQKKIW